MQIITYIFTVCVAAILGVNTQGEAKHKNKEHKEKSEKHEKKSRKHEKKHQKQVEILPEPAKIPDSAPKVVEIEHNVIPGAGNVE